MGSFALDLQKFAAKTKERADAVVGGVVVNIASRLDERSPVGDGSYWKRPPPKGYVGGHFRANWQLGVGLAPSGEVNAVDPSGAATQGRIVASVPADAAGRVYYIVNNAPYAHRLEDGWSRQAPNGMVRLAAQRWPAVVAEVSARAQARVEAN